MYEELIQRLENAAGGPEGIKMAYDAVAAITALQSENGSKDKEIERLHDLLAERNVLLDKYEDEIPRMEAERDATQKEIERMKDIMRQHGIMVIPSKHPGSRPEWNISRGAQGEG